LCQEDEQVASAPRMPHLPPERQALLGQATSLDEVALGHKAQICQIVEQPAGPPLITQGSGAYEPFFEQGTGSVVLALRGAYTCEVCEVVNSSHTVTHLLVERLGLPQEGTRSGILTPRPGGTSQHPEGGRAASCVAEVPEECQALLQECLYPLI